MSDTLQTPAEDDLILTIATEPMLWTDTPVAETDTEGTDLPVESDTMPVTDLFIALEPVIETLFPEAPIALPDGAVDGPVEDTVDNTADLNLDDIVWLNDSGTGTPTDDVLDTWVTAVADQSMTTPVTLTGSTPVASIGRPASPHADGPPHGDTVGTSAWLASNAWLSASTSFSTGWGPAAAAPSTAPAAPYLGGPTDGSADPATDLPAWGLDWVVEDGTVL